MKYILVDIPDRENFYPFTLTRSLADCRIGIFTFKERWEQFVKEECGIYTASYLQNLYPDTSFINTQESIYFINITSIPSLSLIQQIDQLMFYS